MSWNIRIGLIVCEGAHGRRWRVDGYDVLSHRWRLVNRWGDRTIYRSTDELLRPPWRIIR